MKDLYNLGPRLLFQILSFSLEEWKAWIQGYKLVPSSQAENISLVPRLHGRRERFPFSHMAWVRGMKLRKHEPRYNARFVCAHTEIHNYHHGPNYTNDNVTSFPV